MNADPGPIASVTALRGRAARMPAAAFLVGDRDTAAEAIHELADLGAVMDELGIAVYDPNDPDSDPGERLGDRLRRYVSQNASTTPTTIGTTSPGGIA